MPENPLGEQKRPRFLSDDIARGAIGLGLAMLTVSGAFLAHDAIADDNSAPNPYASLSEIKQNHESRVTLAAPGPRVGLSVPPLPAEVKYEYSSAMMGVEVIYRLSKHAKPMGGLCTASYFGSGNVVTAAHCARRIIDDDTQTDYRVISPQGKDLRDREWIEAKGRDISGLGKEKFYPQYDNGNNTYDVLVFKIPKYAEYIEDVGIEPLRTAPVQPEVGSPVYLHSRYEDNDHKVYGGVVVNAATTAKPRMTVLFKQTKKSDRICAPGGSGTPAINERGEAVGILSEGVATPIEVDPLIAKALHIKKQEIGEKVFFCQITPSKYIDPLLEENK